MYFLTGTTEPIYPNSPSLNRENRADALEYLFSTEGIDVYLYKNERRSLGVFLVYGPNSYDYTLILFYYRSYSMVVTLSTRSLARANILKIAYDEIINRGLAKDYTPLPEDYFNPKVPPLDDDF